MIDNKLDMLLFVRYYNVKVSTFYRFTKTKHSLNNNIRVISFSNLLSR